MNIVIPQSKNAMTSSTQLNGYRSTTMSSTNSSNFKKSASISDFHHSFPNSSSSTSRLDGESLLESGANGPPLRGLPVIIVMAKGSELTEDKLEDLRQQVGILGLHMI